MCNVEILMTVINYSLLDTLDCIENENKKIDHPSTCIADIPAGTICENIKENQSIKEHQTLDNENGDNDTLNETRTNIEGTFLFSCDLCEESEDEEDNEDTENNGRKHEASFFCVDCDAYMCSKAYNIHSKIKSTKNHHIVTVDMKAVDAAVKKGEQFKSSSSITLADNNYISQSCIHPSRYEYWCNEDYSLLCPACYRNDHHFHPNLFRLEDIVRQVENDCLNPNKNNETSGDNKKCLLKKDNCLPEILQEIKFKLQEDFNHLSLALQNSLSGLEKELKIQRNQRDDISKQIEVFFDSIIHVIQRRRYILLDELKIKYHNSSSSFLKKIDEQIKSIKDVQIFSKKLAIPVSIESKFDKEELYHQMYQNRSNTFVKIVSLLNEYSLMQRFIDSQVRSNHKLSLFSFSDYTETIDNQSSSLRDNSYRINNKYNGPFHSLYDSKQKSFNDEDEQRLPFPTIEQSNISRLAFVMINEDVNIESKNSFYEKYQGLKIALEKDRIRKADFDNVSADSTLRKNEIEPESFVTNSVMSNSSNTSSSSTEVEEISVKNDTLKGDQQIASLPRDILHWINNLGGLRETAISPYYTQVIGSGISEAAPGEEAQFMIKAYTKKGEQKRQGQDRIKIEFTIDAIYFQKKTMSEEESAENIYNDNGSLICKASSAATSEDADNDDIIGQDELIRFTKTSGKVHYSVAINEINLNSSTKDDDLNEEAVHITNTTQEECKISIQTTNSFFETELFNLPFRISDNKNGSYDISYTLPVPSELNLNEHFLLLNNSRHRDEEEFEFNNEEEDRKHKTIINNEIIIVKVLQMSISIHVGATGYQQLLQYPNPNSLCYSSTLFPSQNYTLSKSFRHSSIPNICNLVPRYYQIQIKSECYGRHCATYHADKVSLNLLDRNLLGSEYSKEKSDFRRNKGSSKSQGNGTRYYQQEDIGDYDALSGLFKPMGICMSPSNRWFYVADQGHNRIVVVQAGEDSFNSKSSRFSSNYFSPEGQKSKLLDGGKVLCYIGVQGKGKGMLKAPQDVFIYETKGCIKDAFTGDFSKETTPGKKTKQAEEKKKEVLLYVTDVINNRIQVYNVTDLEEKIYHYFAYEEEYLRINSTNREQLSSSCFTPSLNFDDWLGLSLTDLPVKCFDCIEGNSRWSPSSLCVVDLPSFSSPLYTLSTSDANLSSPNCSYTNSNLKDKNKHTLEDQDIYHQNMILDGNYFSESEHAIGTKCDRKAEDRRWLFVSDSENHIIRILNATNGKHIRTLGCKGTGIGMFNRPQGISSDGYYLYICDQGNRRVQVFSLFNDEENPCQETSSVNQSQGEVITEISSSINVKRGEDASSLMAVRNEKKTNSKEEVNEMQYTTEYDNGTTTTNDSLEELLASSPSCEKRHFLKFVCVLGCGQSYKFQLPFLSLSLKTATAACDDDMFIEDDKVTKKIYNKLSSKIGRLLSRYPNQKQVDVNLCGPVDICSDENWIYITDWLNHSVEVYVKVLLNHSKFHEKRAFPHYCYVHIRTIGVSARNDITSKQRKEGASLLLEGSHCRSYINNKENNKSEGLEGSQTEGLLRYPWGVCLSSFQQPQNTSPLDTFSSSLAINMTGNCGKLYVVDSSNHRINVYS